MKLPEGWPEAKLPTGWPEPKFDRRLIEAAQNPLYRETALGFEARLRKIFEGNDVGAVITLPYILCPDLRRISCLLARYYGLRRLKNSTTTFVTKNWTAPVYWLEDIPSKKGALQPTVGICIDGSGDNSKEKIPRVVVTSAKSKGKKPMIYGTSEETEGKVPNIDAKSEKSKGRSPIVHVTSEKHEGETKPNKMVLKSGGYFCVNLADECAKGKASKGNMPGYPGIEQTTSSAQVVPGVPEYVKIGDSVKLGLGVNRTETASQAEEVSDVVVGIGGSLNRTETQSPEELNGDDYEDNTSGRISPCKHA